MFYIFNNFAQNIETYVPHGLLIVFKNFWIRFIFHTEINNSSRLMSYCIFKHEFALEKYLSLQIENKYKVAF